MAKIKQPKPQVHTQDIDTANLYSLAFTAKALVDAGMKLTAGTGDVRLVYGARFKGAKSTVVAFVERKTGRSWKPCSKELKGAAAVALLDKLGQSDAKDHIAEIVDGHEEFHMDSDLDM